MTSTMPRQDQYQSAPRHTMADDLITMLDEHLAWQSETREQRLVHRPSSGTLIVDWDGTGEPVVTRRDKHASMVTQPLKQCVEQRVEVGRNPEALQAKVPPRRRNTKESEREFSYRAWTDSSQTKCKVPPPLPERSSYRPTAHKRYVAPYAPLVPPERSPFRNKAEEQHVGPPAPLLTSQNKGKGKALKRFDSAHSRASSSRTQQASAATSSLRVRPLHPRRPPPQTQDNIRSRPAYNESRAPSNYKSSRTTDYTPRSSSTLGARPRSDSLDANYHHELKRETAMEYHRDRNDGIEIRYDSGRGEVKGFDPSQGYDWDYNGRIIHVHCDQDLERRKSGCSEYFEYLAEKHVSKASVRMVERRPAVDKPLPGLPEKEEGGVEVKARGAMAQTTGLDKVVEFVQKLIGKLDVMGIMGKLGGKGGDKVGKRNRA